MWMCNVAHRGFACFARFSAYGRKSSRHRFFILVSLGFTHTSLALLDPFDSARLDPFVRLVCSCGLSQLPFCRGVGAFSTALSSAWPSLDSVSPNQTSESNRLSLIRLRFCPNWLSPIRPRSWLSHPCWIALAFSFSSFPRLLHPTRNQIPHPIRGHFRSFPAPFRGLFVLFSPSSSAHRGVATQAHLRIAETCRDQGTW